MDQSRDDRRRVLGLLAAGLLPQPAFAGVLTRGRNSRLPPLPEDAPYQPPTDLAAVADICRRMTAPVEVDGKGPFAFVVDSGANQSVIATEIAAKLGMTPGESKPLNGVAGVQAAATVTARQLRVGRRIEAGVELFMLPRAALEADGLLGIDRMQTQRLTLDFQARRVRIEGSGRQLLGSADVVLNARSRDGRLALIDADLEGRAVVAFLDSGAQSTIGNLALSRLALADGPTARWATAPIVSATGQTISGERAVLPALTVGKLKLQALPVVFCDLHVFRMWRLIDTPAILLGVDVLSQFAAVSIDFGRSEVRLRLA